MAVERVDGCDVDGARSQEAADQVWISWRVA